MAVTLRQGRFMAEINVTPFVDVMLVLLVIFMVTAPMLTHGLEVDLPQARTVEVLPTESDYMILAIGKDGSLALDEYQVSLESLQIQVKQNVVDKKKQLFLRADREVSYGIVVRVMGLLKEVGVGRLGVVAEPDNQVRTAWPVANSAADIAKPEKEILTRKL